jgi:cysteine desulfurase
MHLRGMRIIYFDYNATTPLDSGVRQSVVDALGPEFFGNPSSVHRMGRRTRAMLDDARDRAAQLLGCKPSEITFTSGGTEANNLAILGTARALRPRGSHLVTSPTEHPAVLAAFKHLALHEGFQLTLLPVSATGQVDPQDVRRSLRPDTLLVSVMSANNETGTLQPIREIGEVCHNHGVVFHTDAVQSFGKAPCLPITSLSADLVSICAHKFHGPKGVGVLYAKSPLRPNSILLGGPQENERRPGTENLPVVMGLLCALERFVDPPVFESPGLRETTARLAQHLAMTDGVRLVTEQTACLPNTVALTVDGADSLSLLAGLDLEGICASSGSACSAGSLEPSHVLLAMGRPHEEAKSFVRFSLGRENTPDEVALLIHVWPQLLARIRSAAKP